VRVSVQTGELEVAGTEAFIDQFRETLDALCEQAGGVTPRRL
jgi:hypothetical protein